jgi:hypothetical protein
MLVVRDRAKFKQILVEARQPGKVVRAQVHMMELELHFIDSFVRPIFILPQIACLLFASLKPRPIGQVVVRRWRSGTVLGQISEL